MEDVLKIFSRFKKNKEQVNLGYLGLFHLSRGIGIAHVVREFGEPPQVLKCDYIPCDAGRSRAKAMAEVVQRAGLGDVPCVGVMDVGSYSLLQIEAPPVAEALDSEALLHQVKDLINYPIDEAVADMFAVPSRAQEKMAYVVAARQEDVRKNVELFHEAKLRLSVMDIPELAVKNLVSLLPENRWGVGFLYFGAHEAVVGVVRDSVLYLSRNINIELEELYEASAETQPQDQNDLMPSRIEKILDRMGLEIQRTFDYYERSSAMAPIGTLVVIPTERPLLQLAPFLDSYLSAEVRLLDLNALFEGLSLAPEEQFRYVLAVACALRQDQDAS